MRILQAVGLAAATSLFFVLSVLAAEKKIKRSDLPPAVEKTVAAQSFGATIQGFSEERENCQTFYEAEMTVNRHNKDILMDAGGVVVEIEEQIAMDSLPAGGGRSWPPQDHHAPSRPDERRRRLDAT